MVKPAPMNGGDGIYSYAKNSKLQGDGFNSVKDVIKEALTENLDVKTLVSRSNTVTIADLGCSVGPNTLMAMQVIIETVQDKSAPGTEFQVFFNDIVSNDFNTLFASLPDHRHYFCAGVPGSFYGRLFPSSSIHVAFSAWSLHWLSRVPEELQKKESPAWNRGKIHYTEASDAVVKAYADQFEEDIGKFLKSRAEEIAAGGVIIILLPGVPDGLITHDAGIALTFFGSILMDMVEEGEIEQDKVDSFNFPHVYPSAKQMKRVVEKNGCFQVVKMELRNARPNVEAPIDIESAIMHLRALTEATLADHFGSEIVDQLFQRAILQKSKYSHMLYSSGIQIGAFLFALLKRK